MKLEGTAKMPRIHFGEEKCRELDIAGATVFRGIEGYGASALIRRPRHMSFSHDAPVMISVIDSEEKIQTLLPLLDEMVA